MNNNFNNINKDTIDAAKRGDTEAILKNLNSNDRKKIEQVLADKNKLNQILNSDAAKKIINLLNGDQKNG